MNMISEEDLAAVSAADPPRTVTGGIEPVLRSLKRGSATQFGCLDGEKRKTDFSADVEVPLYARIRAQQPTVKITRVESKYSDRSAEVRHRGSLGGPWHGREEFSASLARARTLSSSGRSNIALASNGWRDCMAGVVHCLAN
jgi:hypothetical protein